MNKNIIFPLLIILASIGISAVVIIWPSYQITNSQTSFEKSENTQAPSETAKKDLRKADLEIKGMFCLGCRGSVIASVKAQPGIIDVDADPSQDSGWVVYDPSQTTKENIISTPIFSVYPAKVISDQPYQLKSTSNTNTPSKIPPEITQKINTLAKKLKEAGVKMLPFLKTELDTALKKGDFNRANIILNNSLKVYE